MEMKNKNIRKRILTMACGFFVLSSIAQEIAAAGNLTFESTVKSNKSIVQVPLEQCSVDTCDVTRYAIVQKNDRWGIYDLSKHENVTNIDYDYAKFLHRDVVEGDSTVAYCFYAEKGIEQGLILVSGDNNQMVEMWHDNPEYVGNLDECKTIDKGTEKKCFSLLKKGMKYMDGVDGQVAVVDARTGSLKAWVALEKKNNTFVNAKLLKKAFSMRPVILECVTSVLADADGSLEDSIDVCGGIYDSMSGLEIRDHNWRSGDFGMMTVREALVKKSNVAMYKILLSVLCEDQASIIWQKMMDNAQVTNAMEIADLLVGIYNGNVSARPTVNGDSVEVEIDDKVKPEGLKFFHEVLAGLNREGGIQAEYAPKGVDIAGIYNNYLGEEHGKGVVDLAETSFVGLFPADNPVYSVCVFVHRPNEPVHSAKDLAESMVNELVTWLSKN